MKELSIAHSSIVGCYCPVTIGTKVTAPESFTRALHDAVGKHPWETSLNGQALLSLSGANEFVSGGVGVRVNDESRYVARTHRGRVELFLRREYAAPVQSVSAVIYTVEAYLRDPEIGADESERIQRTIRTCDTTHVLVAVLAATTAAQPPMSPYRFLANMAGGNTDNPAMWGEARLLEMARNVVEYDNTWCVVAD